MAENEGGVPLRAHGSSADLNVPISSVDCSADGLMIVASSTAGERVMWFNRDTAGGGSVAISHPGAIETIAIGRHSCDYIAGSGCVIDLGDRNVFNGLPITRGYRPAVSPHGLLVAYPRQIIAADTCEVVCELSGTARSATFNSDTLFYADGEIIYALSLDAGSEYGYSIPGSGAVEKIIHLEGMDCLAVIASSGLFVGGGIGDYDVYSFTDLARCNEIIDVVHWRHGRLLLMLPDHQSLGGVVLRGIDSEADPRVVDGSFSLGRPMDLLRVLTDGSVMALGHMNSVVYWSIIDAHQIGLLFS